MIQTFDSHTQRLLFKTSTDQSQTFLGDAAFDTAQLYKSLLTSDTFGKDKHFHKAYIPLNARSGLGKPGLYHQRKTVSPVILMNLRFL